MLQFHFGHSCWQFCISFDDNFPKRLWRRSCVWRYTKDFALKNVVLKGAFQKDKKKGKGKKKLFGMK